MDKHYQQFKETVDALELVVTKLSIAPDIQSLNASERQAQQALFNLQHTSMGLAYWVQSVAQARRQAINNGEIVIEKTPVENPQPKEEKKTRRKNVSKKKD